MTRREARENAFKLIFEIPFYGNNRSVERLDMFFDKLEENISKDDKQYIIDSINLCFQHIENIDEIISSNLKNWKIERLSKVDLSILRLAVTEILYIDSIPDKVSVNEAVNIAKIFGDDNSPSFINGVLASLVKQRK